MALVPLLTITLCATAPDTHAPSELTKQRGWMVGARAVRSVALACTLLAHLPVCLWEIFCVSLFLSGNKTAPVSWAGFED